jgi:hypothetical protein
MVVLPSHGQEKVLLDELEKPACENLLARLDFFTANVGRNSIQSAGEIVLFQGPDPIENAKYLKFLRRYIIQRKVSDLIAVSVAASGKNLRIEFRLGPISAKRQINNSPINLKLPNVSGPFLFDSGLFEMFPGGGGGERRFFGVACSACCISNLDLDLLSQVLDANPKLTAYVIIRGKRSRHRLLTAEIEREMQEFEFDPKRVRFLYENRNLENSEEFSELEIHLSPKPIRDARDLSRPKLSS